MSDALRLDQQLCFALHAASRAMTSTYQALLDELDLTYTQYAVMLALWEADGARVSALGSKLRLDSATLTPLLKRLEQKGLVERRRSTADERVVEVFLTADGKRLRRRALEIPRAVLAQSGLSVAEATRLRAELQALTARLTPTQG